jgi:hypothetical protein
MAVLKHHVGLQHISHHGGVLEIPPLPDSTILLVEVGSTAHGTGIPGGEDNDEMGVVIEAPHEVLGVGERGLPRRAEAPSPLCVGRRDASLGEPGFALVAARTRIST